MFHSRFLRVFVVHVHLSVPDAPITPEVCLLALLSLQIRGMAWLKKRHYGNALAWFLRARHDVGVRSTAVALFNLLLESEQQQGDTRSGVCICVCA